MLHGRSDVVKVMLPNLTYHNALANNKDGHGYFVVPKMIWRTIEEGNEVVFKDKYMANVEEFIDGDKETTIISHVRAASFKFKELVDIENTHPFQVDNLILMHNGTLATDNEDLEIEKQIDSVWFIQHLADIVKGRKLNPTHIVKAMEEFTGKFAFLIVDMKQPTKIFVVKGRTADLYYTTIRDGRNKVLATAINTSENNLKFSYAPMYWRAIKGTKLIIQEPEELDDESIYIYDTETSELVKTGFEIKEETTVTTTQRMYPRGGDGEDHWHPQMGYHSGYVSPASIDTMIDKISNLAFTMRLGYTEINLIFQLLFNTPLLFAEKEHIEPFLDTLEIIAKEYSNRVGKKLEKWQTIKNSYDYDFPHGNAIDIYNRTGIVFPWFLQSGSGIKRVSSRVKGGNFNWATNSESP
jgi:predicted glutamine amidotransferase